MENNPYEAPKADINVTDGSADILSFDRFSAWGVFGLSIVTLGIYPIYWFYKNTQIINGLHAEKISMNLIYALIGLTVITLALGFTEDPTILMIYAVLNLVYFVVYLIVLFTIRSRLQDIMDRSGGKSLVIGGILTFFFNVIYLQYKINEKIDSLK